MSAAEESVNGTEVPLEPDEIEQIEDALVNAARDTGCFALVESAGDSSVLQYPMCSFILFTDDDTGNKSREVRDIVFSSFVSVKNLRGQEDAQKGFYPIRQAMRRQIHNQTLGLQNGCSPFRVISCRLIGYNDGLITYEIKIKTRWYGDVIVDRG